VLARHQVVVVGQADSFAGFAGPEAVKHTSAAAPSRR
jgi:hypothetical protein